MKIYRIKENKKLIIISLIFFIVLSLLILIERNYYQNKTQKEINNYTNNIINTVIEKYPNITEVELIELLNNNTDKTLDYSKYGIDNNDYLIDNLNNLNKNNNIIVISIIVLSIIIYLVIITKYFKNMDKNYIMIKDTITKINNKIYDLDILENNEDELSNLKNELYKTTIMLKSGYEEAKKDKINLQIATEDISHQLKTPLTSIAILLDNILDDENMSKEDTKVFLKDIRRQIDNMNYLIVTLLKTARFDSGVIEFNKDKINVYDLLNNINKDLSINLELANVLLDIECDKNISFIGDRNWEKEALTNIIKNAIEYSKKQTKIKINVTDNNIYTKIKITNYGNSIDIEEVKNIFKRFYKNNTSSTSFGIGLNLAKSIIEKDNGIIAVKSIENSETSFIIKYMKVGK